MSPPEEQALTKTLLAKLLGPNPAVDLLQKIVAVAGAIGTAWQAINKDRLGAAIAAGVLVVSALWFWGTRWWRRRHPAKITVQELIKGPKRYLRGLLPFEKGDSLLGRDSDLRSVLTIVDREEFRAGYLSGEAGAGKTSFLRAALLPKLEDAGWSVIYVPRMSADPIEIVRNAFRRKIPEAENGSNSLELGRILTRTTSKPVALVCDQLEQFFLAYPTAEARAPFIAELSLFCKDDTFRGGLLLSLRKEFVDDLQDFEPEISELIDPRNKHRLRNWDTQTAIEVLKHGAKHDGVPFSDELVETIAADLAREGIVRPVELQVVATRLHEQGIYEMSRYVDCGRARGVLANYIREFVEPQGDKTPELQRHVARHLLRALCLGNHDVRRPGGVPLVELIANVRESVRSSAQQALVVDAEALERTIKSLIQSGLEQYLLIREDEERVNLAHDYIVGPVRDATGDVTSLEEEADRVLDQQLEYARLNRASSISWGELRFIQHHASRARLTNPTTASFLRQLKRDFIVKKFHRVRIPLVLSTVLTTFVLLLWWMFKDVEPRHNQPLEGAGAKPPAQPVDDPAARGMWPDQAGQDDGALVVVAISGSGSRAAAVGWKALETLRGIPYRFTTAQGQLVESNLANEIDLVAGISGGSFTATAWCLSNGEMEPFRKRFVNRDMERALASNLISRKGAIALFSRYYTRTNFAAELYDQEVFDGKTFGDLPSRPLLRLHATNLALGQRFTFTHETFAFLNSNLNAYPLGYACAASSAFPILLQPLTLRNYPPPLDLAAGLNYLSDKMNANESLNARESLNTVLRVKIRDYYNDKSNRYIHLADGGLIDNQGLQSLLDEFETNGLINRRINYAAWPLRRLIIVNVNGGVAMDNVSGRLPEPPSVISLVHSTMVASMDVLSARRWVDIKERFDEVSNTIMKSAAKSYSLAEKTYAIEISFWNIRDPETRRKAMELPTSFKLTAEQLNLIDQVVPKLLEEDPEMQRLKGELAK